MDLDRILQLAHYLADASGEVIRSYFRQPHLPADTKPGEISSLVTLADRLAEEAMVDLIRRRAPEDGVIREEGEDIPSRNGRYWVLDPIDGTASFARGSPIFGTLIGVVEEGRPLLGIADQPILRERWWGVTGWPSRYNERPILNPRAGEIESTLEEACLVSTTPLMFRTERQRAIAGSLQRVCQRTAFGGDCYNYVMLATGWSAVPMIVLEADLKFYDFCALIPIVRGTGAVITDWSGKPLVAGSTEVLATSNRGLHERVLRAIESVT